MAGAVVAEENSLDGALANLLTAGAGQTRVALATQIASMADDLTKWRDAAALLEVPTLSPDLNATLAAATVTRANDYDVVLAYLAQALSLPGPHATLVASSLGAAQTSLLTTAAAWGAQRHALASAPGAVTLDALTSDSARLDIPSLVGVLAAAPSLAPTRAIAIAAVQVQPAPFPAPALTLELAPTSAMTVQVAVSNQREISQPVTLSVTFTPLAGAAQRVTASQTLSPLTSFAFAPSSFSVFPGERGVLSVTLNGVPAAPGLVHARTYAVSVSPAAAG